MKIRINFKKKMSLGLNDILLYILMFFGLFDTARNYTYLPVAFGYIKDISILLLFFLNRKGLKISFKQNRLAGILITYALLVFLRGFIYSSLNNWMIVVGIIKFLEMFLLMILFLNWEHIFSFPYERMIHFYAYAGTSILIFVNIFGYLVPNPVVSRYIWNGILAQGYYAGRMTVGQPPIAIYPVIMSLLYLMIFNGNWMRMVVYLLAIFVSTSNTGLVSIGLCMAGLLLIKNEKKRNIYIALVVIGILCIYFLVIYGQTSIYLKNIISIYKSKILKVLSGEKDVGLAIRAVHGTAAMNELDNLIDVLIGKGMYGYYSVTNPYRLVENTYISIYCSMGLIGLFLWIFYFLKNLLVNFVLYLRTHNNKNLLLFLITIVVLCHMYTLDIPFCYTIYFSYALFYAFCQEN